MTLTRGKFISDGGEGQIYEVQGHNNLLLKIYKDKDSQGKPIVTQELKHKLEYMKNHPPASLINQGCLAWPLDIYALHGEFGFIMPKLAFDCPLLQIYAYKHPLIDKKNYATYPAVQSRIGVAINLAFAVSELHKAGYIIGDMNHENIGIDKKNAQVRIFDCDSFTITDSYGKTLRTNVCMEGYWAPEIIKHCNSERTKGHPYRLYEIALPTFTKESDLFCLAVHIFKSLMNGIHPFFGVKENAVGSTASPLPGNEGIERNNYVFKQGLRPTAISLASNEIPPNIKSLFDRAFLAGDKNPTNRPTAEEWYGVLSEYLRTLKQCSNNPKHQYYNTLSQCPYCEADKRHYEIQYGTAQPNFAYNNQPIPTPIVPKTFTSIPQYSNQWQNFQLQRTTEPFNKHKSPIRRNSIIAIASIIIGLVIIWPKRTTNQQSTTPQYTPQTETQSSSTNISNETFSIAKYVQTNGLHARSGPGTNYSSLFVVTQNSLVYLSDTSKSGVWVKIKYNNNVGWVNGTFLRDFIIKSVQIGNHGDDGYWITKPGNTLYASQIKHLGVVFDINTINGYNKETTFYLKIITPESTYIQGRNILQGYSVVWTNNVKNGSYSCGTFDIPNAYYTQRPGTWLIQMYYQNPKNDNTFDCIALKYFTLN